jgi:cytochrome c5
MKQNILISALFFMLSASAMAVDDYTMELFGSYCEACHTAASSGAPQSHDRSEWENRMEEKTMAGLVESAIAGIGNMPPMGMCNECEVEDLQDIIEYMATEKTNAK